MDLIEWVELGHTYSSCPLKVRTCLKGREQTKRTKLKPQKFWHNNGERLDM